MIAYQSAINTGVDYLDIDVVVTKDKHLIAYHTLYLDHKFTSFNNKFIINNSKNTEKFCAKTDINYQTLEPYLIKNLTLYDIKKYNIGKINPNSAYSSLFPKQKIIDNTQIASLQEVIDYVELHYPNRFCYQIEIKNNPNLPFMTFTNQELAELVFDVLKTNQIIHRAEIQAFDWDILLRLQNLNANINTAYLIDRLNLSYYQTQSHKFNNSILYMIKSLGGRCYEPQDILLTKQDIDIAHDYGLKVVSWSNPENNGIVFNELLIKQFINWDIDGIITDDPLRLKSLLFYLIKRL